MIERYTEGAKRALAIAQEKAVEYLYKAIEIFEKNVGKEHPL